MRIVAGLFAIGFLVVANGCFVAAEFAYVAVERTSLENAAAGGDRVAGRAVGVLRRLSFMLSGAQLGITATSLLVGFIAEPVSRAALDPPLSAVGVPAGSRPAVAVIVGFLLVTLGQMIVAELVPKNLAIARPERVARLTAGPMTVFMRIFGPLIGFFDAASNRLLRSVGIEPVEELSDVVSVEEFNTILTESVREGSLSANQAGLFERVLTFRELHAGQVATHRGDATSAASAMAGSASAPRPIEQIVMPSWAPASITVSCPRLRDARSARLLPWATRLLSRARRDASNENSTATKNPLRISSTRLITSAGIRPIRPAVRAGQLRPRPR